MSFNTGTNYGIPLTNGVPSATNTMSLSQAANTLAVQVVSRDLSQTNVYTVNELLQPSQTAPQLSNSVSGTTLTLTWPADHLGYRLQVQTNTLNTGLGTNWFDVPSSILTNYLVIPVDPTMNSIFYRLVY